MVNLPTTLSSHEQSDEASAPVPTLMAHNPDALFAKELGSLEGDVPGYGSMIACLLTEMKIMEMKIKGKIKKVDHCPWTCIQKEKSLRRIDKSGANATMVVTLWMIFGLSARPLGPVRHVASVLPIASCFRCFL
jgi:hypothetical protein